MKFDKTVNTFLTLLSVLMILITAFFVERLITHNNVSSVYTSKLSLTGAKLSDDLYTKVSKTSVQKSENGTLTQYEIEIVNSGDTDITNWNLKMAYFPSVLLTDVHNVECSKEGDSYIFSPLYIHHQLLELTQTQVH